MSTGTSTTPDWKPVYTLTEAAKEARVSAEVLKRAIHAKKLDARKSSGNGGGKFLISGKALAAWFEGLPEA